MFARSIAMGAVEGAFLAVVLASGPSFGWGSEGHEYVATLAGKILEADSPDTLRRVTSRAKLPGPMRSAGAAPKQGA